MKYTDPNFTNPYTSKITKSDVGETNINHLYGEDFCRIESSETYWKDRIIELEKEFPDRVVITKEIYDSDGDLDVIVALMPYSDMKKVRPSNRGKNMSEEEKEKRRLRAKEMIASGKMRRKKKDEDDYWD